jgi:hypothetical protein
MSDRLAINWRSSIYSDFFNWEGCMSRKTVQVCDQCNTEIEDGKGGVLRLNFSDARKGAKRADLCESCAAEMPGITVARRGRPKTAA